jgi:hypothetical protein
MQLVGAENLDGDPSTGACTTSTEHQLHSPGALSASRIDGLDLTLPTEFLSDSRDLDWPVRGSTSNFTFDSALEIEQPTSLDFSNIITQSSTYNINQHTHLTTGDLSMGFSWDFMNFPTFDPSSLIDLPFQQFQTSVANRGKHGDLPSSVGVIFAS